MDQSAPIKVFLVDDSTFVRVVLAKYLNKFEDLIVVGQASDGIEALELIPETDPDVVVLDVVMPRLDGIQTLERIMTDFPRPVIMLSSLTREGADETVQALTLGAIDFIPKPSSRAELTAVIDELRDKIIQASEIRKGLLINIKEARTPGTPGRKIRRIGAAPDRVVVIGCSTGGPRALTELIPQLPGNHQAAYIVVQHMPDGFTGPLAERLNQISNLTIREAKNGDPLTPGQVLVARGGYHLDLLTRRKVRLFQGEKVRGVRPAVDVTMASAAEIYREKSIGVVLTGMGFDGRDGALAIQRQGGRVIAEDQSSCVIWGMPRAVVEARAADIIAPLSQIANELSGLMEGN